MRFRASRRELPEALLLTCGVVLVIVDELRDGVEVMLLGQEIFVLGCGAHHIMADGALRLPKGC